MPMPRRKRSHTVSRTARDFEELVTEGLLKYAAKLRGEVYVKPAKPPRPVQVNAHGTPIRPTHGLPLGLFVRRYKRLGHDHATAIRLAYDLADRIAHQRSLAEESKADTAAFEDRRSVD